MGMLNDRLPIESVTRRRLGHDRRTTKRTNTGLLGKLFGDSQVRCRRSSSGRFQAILEYALNHLCMLLGWAIPPPIRLADAIISSRCGV